MVLVPPVAPVQYAEFRRPDRRGATPVEHLRVEPDAVVLHLYRPRTAHRPARAVAERDIPSAGAHVDLAAGAAVGVAYEDRHDGGQSPALRIGVAHEETDAPRAVAVATDTGWEREAHSDGFGFVVLSLVEGHVPPASYFVAVLLVSGVRAAAAEKREQQQQQCREEGRWSHGKVVGMHFYCHWRSATKDKSLPLLIRPLNRM